MSHTYKEIIGKYITLMSIDAYFSLQIVSPIEKNDLYEIPEYNFSSCEDDIFYRIQFLTFWGYILKYIARRSSPEVMPLSFEL